jgi:hypothetical protein
MLISSSVWRALNELGVTVTPVGPDRVELSCRGFRGVFTVVSAARPLHPGDIAALSTRHAEPCLLLVPAATPAVRQAAESRHWSLLAGTGHRVEGTLLLGDRRILVDAGEDTRPRPVARPGRVPWGTYTLLRRLVERPTATQRELAGLAGVSQPRVSQALRSLAEHDLVRRTGASWRLHELDEALGWWLKNYPGPGGITTFWYGLAAPVQQAHAVAALLGTATGSGATRLAVSGDVAADLLVPWRSPYRAVLYLSGGLDPGAVDLTPAGEEEATLELSVPADPGLWSTSATTDRSTRGLPLADPLQILWDLQRAPGADARESMERMWRLISTRYRQHAA